MRLTDDNGIPTVEAALALVEALSEAQATKAWWRVERARRLRDEHIAMRAAHLGIPLVAAGNIWFTMGTAQWTAEDARWLYEGMTAYFCKDCNVTVVATQAEGMSAQTFGRLWRRVVRDLMRSARCVRVRLAEQED